MLTETQSIPSAPVKQRSTLDLSASDKMITGTILYKAENEEQKFVCHRPESDSDFVSIKLLCDFLTSRKLLVGDRILISEPELIEKLKDLGWTEKVAQDRINALCSFEIKMVDAGEETDSFFVHF